MNYRNQNRHPYTKFFLDGLIVIACLALALPVMANWSQSQKITSTPRGVGAQFGNAVAINGNTMVVGARLDSTTANQAGAAFVYVRNGTTWTQQAILLAMDGAAADKFGYSVAISEDTIVVGAFNDDSPLSNAGSAYVFVRNGTTWSFQQKLTASDPAADDQFGISVAVGGPTVYVGANFADQPSNSDAGAVYRFTQSGTVWTQVQKLIPAGGVILGDHFGDSVAASGNHLAVGAGGTDIPQTAAGSVYVFVEGGGGIYTQQDKISIPSGANGDNFGYSVSLEGNTLVGGAPEATPMIGQPAYGAAYVYEFNGATWVSQGRLVASDGATVDLFGYSVAVSNNVVAVGARGDDTVAAGPDAGSVYIYTRGGTTWTERDKLAPTDPFNGDRFGTSVALSFGNLIVGAAEKALTVPNGQGAAYYFTIGGAAAFDFDGDGKSDVSVFRPSNGLWYLLQSTAGFTGVPFGISTDKIVPADYDGDGKTDIAVYRSGTWYLLRSTLGFASVPFGGPSDIPQPADFDGDGKADVAVFRPSNGTWYIFNLVNSQFSAVQFGASTDMPVVGDYDGDGKADHAVYRNGTWYLLRSSLGFTAITFGVGTDKPVVGDYDGDGKADVAVFRPSNGTWYLQQSTAGFTGIPFGIATDLPAPADYDGDGKTDVAVFRNGTWYQLRSTQGFASVPFGATGDRPIPNAFVP